MLKNGFVEINLLVSFPKSRQQRNTESTLLSESETLRNGFIETNVLTSFLQSGPSVHLQIIEGVRFGMG
jgi:hypothetical protein